MLTYKKMKKKALRAAPTADSCKDYGGFLFFFDSKAINNPMPAPGGYESIAVMKDTGELNPSFIPRIEGKMTIDPPILLNFETGEPEGDADAE